MLIKFNIQNTNNGFILYIDLIEKNFAKFCSYKKIDFSDHKISLFAYYSQGSLTENTLTVGNVEQNTMINMYNIKFNSCACLILSAKKTCFIVPKEQKKIFSKNIILYFKIMSLEYKKRSKEKPYKIW